MSAHFVRVLPLDALPEGAMQVVRVGNEPILLLRVAGDVSALQARCPHAGGDMSQGRLEGGRITCPLHGSQFDIRDGALLRGPAVVGLRRFPVRVSADWIEIEVEA